MTSYREWIRQQSAIADAIERRREKKVQKLAAKLRLARLLPFGKSNKADSVKMAERIMETGVFPRRHRMSLSIRNAH